MSDDYTQDNSTTGALSVGDSATGEIETGGDADWFKVRLQAGKTYRIDLEGSPTRAGTLEDPQLLGIHDYRGTLLLPDIHSDDGGVWFNSRLFFTANRYGDHYIAVGAWRDRKGTYKLLVEEVKADDYADGEDGALSVEGSVTGEIELPGDRDRFELALEAGRTYRIELDGSPVAARQIYGRLYDLRDEEGNLITSVTRDGDTRLYFRPGADGVYSIEVGGLSNSARNTGIYTLSVQDVTRVDDYTAAAGAVVTVGGSVTGEIEKPGDIDWFAVTLVVGAFYQVDLQGSSTGEGTLADPLLRGIFEDNGSGAPGDRIADTGDNNSGAGEDSLVLFRTPESATYYIATGTNGGATGTYTVSVREIQEYSADFVTAGAVQVGGSISSALETDADEDWFAVSLEAGVEYRFEVKGNTRGDYGGSLYNPALTVYDAEGEILYTASAWDVDGKLGRNVDLQFTPEEAGAYFIGIDGNGFAGTYTLSVNRLTDEYSTMRLTRGRVEVGGSATGEIGLPRDKDWFAVELVGGRVYRIDLEGSPTDQGTLDDPYLRGIYFDKELIPGAVDDDGGVGYNSRVDFIASESGTYYISAGAYSIRTGSYRVSVEEPADDHPAAPDTGAVVAVDGSAAGVVDYGGDEDWFAVTLVAGHHYKIDLEGTSTGQGALEDPYLRGIYDAEGNLIAGAGANDDGGEGYNSHLEFTAPETAVYYIAAGAHATHTGSYLLSVDKLVDDYPAATATGAVVTVDGSAMGEIERPGDADWFAVELTGGREYQIDLEGWRTDQGTLDDPYLLGIHDIDGELIPGTTDDDGGAGLNSRLYFEAPETGTYYIATGAYEDYTGTYTLEIMDVL